MPRNTARHRGLGFVSYTLLIHFSSFIFFNTPTNIIYLLYSFRVPFSQNSQIKSSSSPGFSLSNSSIFIFHSWILFYPQFSLTLSLFLLLFTSITTCCFIEWWWWWYRFHFYGARPILWVLGFHQLLVFFFNFWFHRVRWRLLVKFRNLVYSVYCFSFYELLI